MYPLEIGAYDIAMEPPWSDTLALHRSRSRHHLARVMGAVGLAVLAQDALNMPGSYLGPASSSTAFGWIFAISIAGLLALTGVGYERRHRWAGIVARGILGIIICVFAPAIPSDPLIAGGMVLWNLILLTQFIVFPLPPLGPVPGIGSPIASDWQSSWVASNGRALLHLTMVALLMTLLTIGYGIGHRVPTQLICGLFDVCVLAYSWRYLLALARKRQRRIYPALAFLAASVVSLARPTLALALFAGFLLILWIILTSMTQIAQEIAQHFIRHPAGLVVLSFAILIALGTIFLSVPIASSGPARIDPLDAMFTATSAACVTGLIVCDTPNDFTFVGQLIILFLIQVGGLSIMVLSMFAALVLGRDLGWRGERLLSELLDIKRIGDAARMAAFIVLATMLCETAGAAVLTHGYLRSGYAPLAAVWRGIFHAVSAFCNAGFALQSNSVVLFRDDPVVLLTLAILIVLGGLGFVVLAWLWSQLRSGHGVHFSLQGRIVLAMTGALLLTGTVLTAILDWNGTLADLPWGLRLVNAFFQSATLRTAGFNTMDLSLLHPALVLSMLVFMFIGASPGGTGGGIKTTTAAVLFGTIPALAHRKPEIVFNRRTIPYETIYRSAAIAVIGGGLVLIGSFLLLITQQQPASALVFEAFSAFGTVGLSLGATAQLNSIGKVIIIVMMFAGRVGPLTLAILLGRRREAGIGYPEARIMVG